MYLSAQTDSLKTKNISEVIIINNKIKAFETRRLKPVEGTSIFAAKKTEVVLMDTKIINKALNNPRQIYSQIAGINVFDSNDGGLQLNVGGRGLNPNRTANFNTRQNGYDISADVLGYPESYYTPTAEAIDEIQVVRGAASLQYGTQFGGLLNFKLKKPNRRRKIQFTSRNTIASFGTHTSFNSLTGKLGDFSYYGFFNYKKGDGFQENSDYKSQNGYLFFNYDLSKKTKFGVEFTKFKYLAHQPGGLTDYLYNQDPYQSIRARNWFNVDWNLWSVFFNHQFNKKQKLSVKAFGLDAKRESLGYRPARVGQPDYEGATRDLITGKFRNWGVETKFLQHLGKKKHTLLVGAKYYRANNTGRQGAGSKGSDADFNFDEENTNYYHQSDYTYPNQNVALFSEFIFKVSKDWSIVPGVRWEYIDTKAKGFYKKIILDNAGNTIFNETYHEDEKRLRNFFILGIGTSYKPNRQFEAYANLSQNYRSVTFSDIRMVNNALVIDPDIKDETGYTADIGVRGKWRRVISYDIGVYGLFYNNRIDNVFRQAEGYSGVQKVRTNVGEAVVFGVESLIDFNLKRLVLNNNKNWRWNIFANTAITHSEYVESETPGIKGNSVEFVPTLNLKTGMSFGYKNLLGSILLTKLSEQYTSATNEPTNPKDNTWGIQGTIPAYQLVDFVTSYRLNKHLKIEAGVSNIFNEVYFTRRATGYPGPGIIPSAPREYFLTVEMKF